MKKLVLLFSIVLIASLNCPAQTSGFTYQGKLGDGGSPANGDYQFQVRLFDDPSAGYPAGPPLTIVAAVQNGIFTTRLDFGWVVRSTS